MEEAGSCPHGLQDFLTSPNTDISSAAFQDSHITGRSDMDKTQAYTLKDVLMVKSYIKMDKTCFPYVPATTTDHIRSQ